MPGNNYDIGSFTINIDARIKGYAEEIEKMRKALQDVGKSTDLSKGLKQQAQNIIKIYDDLNKKTELRINSESQIQTITDKFHLLAQGLLAVGQGLSRITDADLDLSHYNAEISLLEHQIQSLQQSMDETFNQGFNKAARGSNELVNAFKLIGQSMNNLSQAQIGQILSDEMRAVDAQVEQAEAEFEKLEEVVNTYKKHIQDLNNAEESRPVLIDNFVDSVRKFNSGQGKDIAANFENFVQTIKKNISLLNIGTDSNLKASLFDRIDLIFSQTDVDTIVLQLRSMLAEIRNAVGDKSIQLGDLLGWSHTTHVTDQLNTFKNILSEGIQQATSSAVSEANLNEVKARFQDLMSQMLNLGLDQTAAQDFQNQMNQLFDSGQVNIAMERILDRVNEFRPRLETELQQTTQVVDKSLQDLDQARVKYENALQAQNILQSGKGAYEGIIQQLQNSVKTVEEQLKKLEAQLQAVKARKPNSDDVRKAGSDLTANAKKLLEENTRAAEQYEQQLARVQAAEKLVGKIQGLLQRWFSVYAVIRMINNGIKSMKNLIEEIDKTITEIAIVTKMDQSQLWAQIPQYTQMAKEFGASISGVYQVSQLYYQQGLETADVMALTSETLKMARISGLDYADATNYMTNAVRSFKLEMTEAQTIVDVYSAIAASSATSTKELAIAMSKTASSAQAVGSSFENTTAMIAVMMEATR